MGVWVRDVPAGWAVLPTHRMAVVDGEGVEEEREEGRAVQHSCATLTVQGELAGGKEKGRRGGASLERARLRVLLTSADGRC